MRRAVQTGWVFPSLRRRRAKGAETSPGEGPPGENSPKARRPAREHVRPGGSGAARPLNLRWVERGLSHLELLRCELSPGGPHVLAQSARQNPGAVGVLRPEAARRPQFRRGRLRRPVSSYLPTINNNRLAKAPRIIIFASIIGCRYLAHTVTNNLFRHTLGRRKKLVEDDN